MHKSLIDWRDIQVMYMLSCLLHLHKDRSWQLGHRIKSKFDKMLLLHLQFSNWKKLCHQHFSTCILEIFELQKLIFWRFQGVPGNIFSNLTSFEVLFIPFEYQQNINVIDKVESTFCKLRFPIFAFLNYLFEVWKYMLGLQGAIRKIIHWQ